MYVCRLLRIHMRSVVSFENFFVLELKQIGLPGTNYYINNLIISLIIWTQEPDKRKSRSHCHVVNTLN